MFKLVRNQYIWNELLADDFFRKFSICTMYHKQREDVKPMGSYTNILKPSVLSQPGLTQNQKNYFRIYAFQNSKYYSKILSKLFIIKLKFFLQLFH